MKKINNIKKYILAITSTVVLSTITLATITSCSKTDNNNGYIQQISIDGNTNLNVGDTLNLNPNIIWNNNDNLTINYKWTVVFENGDKKEYSDQQNLIINNITDAYNGAKIILEITVNNNYSKSANVIINVNNSELISIINDKPFISNVNNIYASQLWDNIEEIKNLILNNKYRIFNFYDSNFDLEKNLKNINVEKNSDDNNNGTLNITFDIPNIYSNQKLTCQGFKINGFDKSPADNVDYFVLPNSNSSLENRITIPTTNNYDILNKYGNAPLPWKDDSEISENDLINMFNYLCMNMNSLTINFGARKIEANKVADAFCQWHIKYRKYFPYKFFNNPTIMMVGIDENGKRSSEYKYSEINTDQYINKTKWYIYEIKWVNYEPIYYENEFQDGYINFINNFFKYVQPNMTDMEKFILSSNYVMNWLWYKEKGFGQGLVDNGGVCADYADLLSLCLSFLDVPAIPMVCGYQSPQMHEITWIYLDLNGDGNKKWYASDPTWADYDNINYFNGISAMALPYDSSQLDWLLFDVAVNQFKPIDSTIVGNKNPYQHDISNLVFNLPWSNGGQNISSIGEISYGTTTNYLASNFEFLNNNRFNKTCQYSRSFYLNGYTYYFARNFSTNNNGVDLYKTKMQFNSAREKVAINLPKEFKDKFSFLATNDTSISYPPLVQQYGNKIVLLLNPNISNNINYQRSLLIINTSESEILWETAKEYFIPNDLLPNSKYIYNFDININGTIRFDCGNNFSSTNISNYETVDNIDLGNDFKSHFMLNENNFTRWGDIEVFSQYLSALIGMYKIGDKPGYISINEKSKFYTDLNKHQNSVFETAKYYSNLYENIKNKIMYNDQPILVNKKLNDVYFKTQYAFDNFGFSISNLVSIYDPKDMFTNETNIKYNIYYSNNKDNGFVLIKENSLYPKFDKNDLNNNNIDDPNGYYYIELVHGLAKYKTNVFELKIQENDYLIEPSINFYSDDQPNNINTKITNYNPRNIDWSYDALKYYFEINYNSSLFLNDYKFDIKFQHINIDQPKVVKTILNNEYFLNYDKPSRISGKIDLEQTPNADNHGIYYLEVDVIDNNTNSLYKFYSDYIYILDERDYYSWDKIKWINALI